MRTTAVVFIAAITLSCAASAADIYKWIEDGETHYGPQPPAGTDAERVDVRIGTGQSGAEAQPTEQTEDQGSEPSSEAADAEPSQKATADVEFLQKQCDSAAENVETLSQGSAGNRRFRNPDGEVVRYTQEQLEERLARNRRFLGEYCQGK